MAENLPSFSPIRMTATSEATAVEQALQIVGATREQVSVEIISQDAKGVTVRVSPRREGEAQSAQSASAQAEAAPQTQETAPIENADAPQSIEDDNDFNAQDDNSADTEDNNQEFAAESGEIADDGRDGVQPAREPIVIDEATQERALDMAQEFLDRMGMEAQVRLGDADSNGDSGDRPSLHIEIEGEDVGILIGKHGQTLQAFQYLLNVTLNNQSEVERDKSVRVLVDAGGYRARRSQSLEQTAHDAASRAKRDRRSIRMEPMAAYERRLVHMILQNDNTVTTASEGRDPMRCVVVTPANMRPSSGGERASSERSSGDRGGSGGNRGRGGFGGFGGNRGGASGGGGGNRSGGFGGFRRDAR